MTMTTMKIENRNDDVVNDQIEKASQSVAEALEGKDKRCASPGQIVTGLAPTHHSFPVLIQTRCASLSFVNS